MNKSDEQQHEHVCQDQTGDLKTAKLKNFEEHQEIEVKESEDKPKGKKIHVEKSIFEKINLPQCMLNKTSMCKHNFGCYENSLRGLYRSFVWAYIIKTLLLNITSIINPKKLFKNLINKKNNIDTFKFALFISCLNGFYKAILCFLRRYIQNDKINAGIAGFLSGLSMFIDSKSRREFLALVVFARSLDSLVNLLEKRGLFKKIKYGEVALWSVMACFNKYCMSYEPDCLNPSFRKFYLKASAMTHNDIELCNIWAEILKRQQMVKK